ncbi:MAG: hypothetical protein HUU34_05725 [Saprospiraceae bacterium]|nr:hypothetical protein [Saprospiraceae bacterium]
MPKYKVILLDRVSVDTLEVFRILDRDIKTTSKAYIEVKVLNGQFLEIEREYRLAKISYEEFLRFKSKIWSALGELINSLELGDLNTKQDFNILVVCRNADDQIYMQQYIDALPLDAEVISTQSYYPPEGFALVVFDGHTLGSIPKEEALEKLSEDKRAHFDLLKNYLQKAPKWIVYFGEFNYLLNDYREITHAANNKFSLYARIKEMRDYIADLRVGGE